MKKISYYEALARNKKTGKEEFVMVIIKGNYKGEQMDRLCPITSIDFPEEIGLLMTEDNPTDYVVLQAEPRYVQEEKPYVKVQKEGIIDEMIMIAAIISDAWLKQIYNQKDIGYFGTLDIITDATKNFYKQFEKHIEDKTTEWEEVCGHHGVPCYDDLVIKISGEYLSKKHDVVLDIDKDLSE